MKTDRELLELAAKAAGLEFEWCDVWGCMAKNLGVIDGFDSETCWNPLSDDGDALRLAVKAGMRVYVYSGGGDDYTCVATDELSVTQATIKVMHDEDSLSATRRAIVRAAAAIGESMP